MKLLRNLCLLIALSTLTVVSQAQTTPASQADSSQLKVYVGSYTFASDSPIQKFTVTTEKGDLYGEADAYGKNKLLKQDKTDTYKSTSSYGSIITFVREANQAVTGLTMAVQGAALTAKKDKP